MHPALEIATVVVWGMFKMVVAAGLGTGFGLPLLLNFLFTSTGGCLGVLLFHTLSDRLLENARRRWMRRRERAIEEGRSPSPIFTRSNRRIVRVKRASGYWGVAALTPLVLTIPVGGILMARFFKHERRALPVLLASVVLQSLAVTAAFHGLFWTITGA